MHEIMVRNIKIGNKNPLVLIAGPCVIEGRKKCLELARRLKILADAEKIPLIFKASYDKANRTSHQSSPKSSGSRWSSRLRPGRPTRISLPSLQRD